mmetsp:Transcript_26060/g.83836  ORF Transcript_26060/g.83836 Transcript_26060/m.83836 type:complete len:218 (-) Transcript_26060:117-770(-)
MESVSLHSAFLPSPVLGGLAGPLYDEFGLGFQDFPFGEPLPCAATASCESVHAHSHGRGSCHPFGPSPRVACSPVLHSLPKLPSPPAMPAAPAPPQPVVGRPGADPAFVRSVNDILREQFEATWRGPPSSLPPPLPPSAPAAVPAAAAAAAPLVALDAQHVSPARRRRLEAIRKWLAKRQRRSFAKPFRYKARSRLAKERVRHKGRFARAGPEWSVA